MNLNKYLLYLLLLIPLSACNNDDNDTQLPFVERGGIVESIKKGELTKAQITDRVDELPIGEFAKNDVSYHIITYRTQYEGKPIDSKGLLLVPANVDPSAKTDLIAYFHGTQLPLGLTGVDDQIPSFYNGQSSKFREVINMGFTWATAGYAVFLPDYIGYGITKDKEHPYVYFPEMFESNIDGILAAKKLLVENGIMRSDSKRLFLTGWSQGAGASLSAHKYIEERYNDQFTVVASSGLAGPYNFLRFVDEVFKDRDKETVIMPIISWGVYSMNKFSSLRRPSDQIWAYEVYDQMSSVFTPSSVPNKVFNNYFLAKMVDGSDVAFHQILETNSFHAGWTPKGKVYLHHGDADDVVPYFNSEDALSGLIASGGDVKLYTYPEGKHDTELGNYIRNTLNDFNTLK